MGRSQSKAAPQDGPIVSDTQNKFGPTSLDMSVEKYGFPTGALAEHGGVGKLELRLNLEKEKIAERKKQKEKARKWLEITEGVFHAGKLGN